MENTNSLRIEPLNENNYAVWSMKMEALLDAKNLFEDVIVKESPQLPESKEAEVKEWTKKNKEALSLIVLSLTSEQAIVYKGIKKAKDIWDAIKIRFEGAVEDRQMDLTLELTKLKKSSSETIEQYLTRAQGISRQISELGKVISERELVRYIVEGLNAEYNAIITVLSANRGISITDLRQTLLNYEKDSKEKRGYVPNAFKTYEKNKFKQKLCFICNKPGHIQSQCWYKKENVKRENIKNTNRGGKKWNNNRRNENANISNELTHRNNKTETALSLREINCDDEQATWYLDSACTSHMTSDEQWMINKQKENKIVNVAEEGRIIESSCRGDVCVTTLTENEEENLRLKDVLHVPKLRGNLMSVPNIVKNGNEVILNSEGAFIYDCTGKLICQGSFAENMFAVQLKLRKNEQSNEICLKSKEELYELWHRRLGHLNHEYLMMLKNKNMVRGLDDIEGKIKICDPCVRGKMSRHPVEPTYSETTDKPLERLHMDLCGPFQVSTLGGNKYMMVVVDEFSRRYFTTLLKTKDEAKSSLEQLIRRRENELDAKVKNIRSDNGGEFINYDMKEYLEYKGIKHEKTVIHSPWSNGIAERANRTLLDKARTLLIDSELPVQFWGEAVATAEYLHNRTPTKRKDKTPMELWNSRKPSVCHLKPFGCLAYYKVDRRQKLDDKAKKGIFIGYSTQRKAYRIFDWEEQKVYETCNVIFHETKKGYNPDEKQTPVQNFIELEYVIESENKNQEIPIIDDIGGNDEIADTEDQSVTPTGSERPVRNRKLPQKYDDYIMSDDYVMYSSIDEAPITYESAVKREDGNLWKVAMIEEMKSMKEHEVWELVKRPEDKKIIKSRWVYKIKDSEDGRKYKARLVAVGCNQLKSIHYEESYAPVMKMESLRLLIAVAASLKLKIKYLDIKTAYLYATLKESVYMEQPKGFIEDEEKVCLLKKSLYGLPQSGKCWNDKLNKILTEIEFIRLKTDPCIYVYQDGNNIILIGVYVDDILVIGSSDELINEIMKKLSHHISFKERNTSDLFLGIRIDETVNGFVLSQKHHIKRILKRYGLEDCNPVKTPGDANQKLSVYENSKSIDRTLYQEMVGSLMYLSTGTRPDISFNISELSQYNHDPREIHLIAIKRIYRYLKGTQDYGLHYNASGMEVCASTDASWCTTNDGKSFSGYTVKLGNSLIAWKAKKQNLVALSTCEAELMAICEGVCELKWLTNLLAEINVPNNELTPTILKTDSLAAIGWINSVVPTSRTKHINRKYYFVRDEVTKGDVKIEHVPTEEMEADILTKSLGKELFELCVRRLGLGN